jgi:hypothetical protein
VNTRSHISSESWLNLERIENERRPDWALGSRAFTPKSKSMGWDEAGHDWFNGVMKSNDFEVS